MESASESRGQRITRAAGPNHATSPADLFPRTDRFRMAGSPLIGGMGIVFRATDVGLDRTVAIKRIRPEFSADEPLVSRFLREARALARLDHPNIVKVLELSSDFLGHWIVMNWIEGRSLADVLKEHTTIPRDRAIDIICQIASGLQQAHDAGLYHRDIKPANILLEGPDRAILVDFGLVRIESDLQPRMSETVTGAMLGTVEFVSPEQLRDPRTASAFSDQWSLAATLYQMLTGFSVRARDDDMLPQEIRPAIQKALKPIPGHRFETVRDFAQALKGADVATGLMSEAIHAPRAAVSGDTQPLRGDSSKLGIPEISTRALPHRAEADAHEFRVIEPTHKRGKNETQDTRMQRVPRPQGLAAPFTADIARATQEAWAQHLGIGVEVRNTIGMKLRVIPPGIFEMGSPTSEPERRVNEVQHIVTISQPKLLGV